MKNLLTPPHAVAPLPSKRQLDWQELEYYGFIHFTVTTFMNMEWGTGGESPSLFNPNALDAHQWVKVAKDAGMKGLILTAKHHDGFCLWPTKTTEHSVKNSPWKDGKGDVVRELADACKEYGIKLGIYLSPWDRNHKDYGTDAYIKVFHEQLRELLTNYGELFEVWFDGANTGLGYYGGANEVRKVDKRAYYEWDKTTEIVRVLQPNAVIFSDAGPDVRWVGNEEGWANETNWSSMRGDEVYPGWDRYVEAQSGHENGTHWLPSEVNTSIRPSWFYHDDENHLVKSLSKLTQIYYESIGRNGTFLLNLPVDKRGLIHENDIYQLMLLKNQIDKDFSNELAKNQPITSSNVRGNSPIYNANKANDGDKNTYWATDDGVTSSDITIAFAAPTPINRILLQEYIALGQRIQKFTVAAEINGQWVTIDEQTTIGYKRILRFETVTATRIKVSILASKGAIALSNIALYCAPNFLVPPHVFRNQEGMTFLSVPDDGVDIYYSLDNSEPTMNSKKYTDPFLIDTPTTLRAIAINPENCEKSESVKQYFDVPEKDWKVIFPRSEKAPNIGFAIDDNPDIYGAIDGDEVMIDLGKIHTLQGFSYLPMQDQHPFGMITNYCFSVSTDGKSWQQAAKGEFGNIVNNPIEQKVHFTSSEGRYIKLKAIAVTGAKNEVSFGRISILTTK